MGESSDRCVGLRVKLRRPNAVVAPIRKLDVSRRGLGPRDQEE